jgi:hypothetical protein
MSPINRRSFLLAAGGAAASTLSAQTRLNLDALREQRQPGVWNRRLGQRACAVQVSRIIVPEKFSTGAPEMMPSKSPGSAARELAPAARRWSSPRSRTARFRAILSGRDPLGRFGCGMEGAEGVVEQLLPIACEGAGRFQRGVVPAVRAGGDEASPQQTLLPHSRHCRTRTAGGSRP